MNEPTVTIFARWPEPGKVKTRLIGGIGAERACMVYSNLLKHTVTQARKSELPMELRVTGAPADAFREWLGPDLMIADQGDGDLGDKLARVPAPALLIGSDCPGLNADILREAAIRLTRYPVVIGPANDGGYYLLGIADPMSSLFDGMPWSTERVLPETLARLGRLGIEPGMLDPLDDIDTPADLARYPEFAA